MTTQSIIVKHLAGSHAYGTNIETSDVDFRGIFVADQKYIRTPFFNVKEVSDSKEEDTKFIELNHYLKLLVDCNPNIQETVWIDESDIIFQNEIYRKLRDSRDQLISSKVAYTYSGYAISQLNRIKGHNKWITNPQPEKPPHEKDFLSVVFDFTSQGLRKIQLDDYKDGYRLVPYARDVYGLYEAEGFSTFSETNLNTTFDGDSHELGNPLVLFKFNKQDYNDTKRRHEQYWTWKKERNAARSELEEKYGYDTKHAMHLVRLLRMGKEILETGQVHIKRPDAAELLQIRNGALSYEELIHYGASMDKEIHQLARTTNLRKRVDPHFASDLLMELQDLAWNNQTIEYFKETDNK